MEYEIDDDPQGLPDKPEADRDGGVREPMFFRRKPVQRPAGKRRDAAFEQMGEPS